MSVRLMVRGFASGKRLFEEKVECDGRALEEVAKEHILRIAEHPRHMLEIEFLDEPDPNERYFRFGSDPSQMAAPVEANLEKKP